MPLLRPDCFVLLRRMEWGHAGSIRATGHPPLAVMEPIPSRWDLTYEKQKVMISRGRHTLILWKVPEEEAASRFSMAPSYVWSGRERREPTPALSDAPLLEQAAHLERTGHLCQHLNAVPGRGV